MRHMIMLDLDDPLEVEATLIVNGFASRMSYEELHKLMLDCQWAVTSINNVRLSPIAKYKECSRVANSD